ncbi:MAG: lipocalin-like domain-containing protein [Candidatus Acidiferrales bacterium]
MKSENPLLGTWRLMSIEGVVPKAAVFSMGAKPRGILMYDTNGLMAAQIMRDPRPEFPTGYESATPEEIKDAFEGYYCYFGTYEVDIENKMVTHRLEGCLRPKEVGREFVRAFKLSGDTLVLTPVRNGKKVQTRLIWERAK